MMESNVHTESDMPAKNLFRIGEVSRLTSTKPFVLRFWETEFPMLQPVKSPKGHRLYRREDIETVFVIKRLLYDEGFTIAGARRHLRDQAAELPDANGALNRGINGGEEMTANATSTFPVDDSNEPFSALESPAERHDSDERHHAAEKPDPARQAVALNRQTLLDLRDSLRSLLTALESE
jgi:DNA-binding transcriptional MerR regulator